MIRGNISRGEEGPARKMISPSGKEGEESDQIRGPPGRLETEENPLLIMPRKTPGPQSLS